MVINISTAFMIPHFSNSLFPSHREAYEADVKDEHFLLLSKKNLNCFLTATDSNLWPVLHSPICSGYKA